LWQQSERRRHIALAWLRILTLWHQAITACAADTAVRVRHTGRVRLVVARCSALYRGRLQATLDSAVRLIIVKSDGSVLLHSDAGGYRPLVWMSAPCDLRVDDAGTAATDPASGAAADCGLVEQPGRWTVTNRAGEELVVTVEEILHDSRHELGPDRGVVKDGVEAHLQALLAEHIHTLGDGYRLVQREYMTAIGPVDILCRDGAGATVAVEIKRRGEIDGVEQLTRYLELLNRDPLLSPVRGVFAAQEIKPQARTLATDRGIDCVTLDYDALRGIAPANPTLF
jgi:RecB family endonuclease NucS